MCTEGRPCGDTEAGRESEGDVRLVVGSGARAYLAETKHLIKMLIRSKAGNDREVACVARAGPCSLFYTSLR